MHAQAPISSIAGNRCVYYARYSTEDQKESSIERQIEGCESYALSYGMTPLQGGHQFIDRGKSGFYLEGRDDLAALRLLATHGGKGFDKLVCEHLDRLSRNVVHVLQIYHELKALGIEIHVTSGGVGRVDDVHAVLYGFIGMEQRERMLRLMSQGAWRAALRGRHLGGIPYGYRRGQEVGDLVVEENEAAVVKRIYHLFDSGVSATQIARLLNGENLPPPSGSGQWTRSVILGGPSHGKGQSEIRRRVHLRQESASASPRQFVEDGPDASEHQLGVRRKAGMELRRSEFVAACVVPPQADAR